MKTKRKTPCGFAAATGFAPVLVLPLGTPETVLAEARGAGYLPVLADDPTKVAVVLPSTRHAGDDLIMSALHGLAATHSTSERSRMVEELHRRMLAREAHSTKDQATANPK